jgi:drug/metabolite transporter (DMT)-like permease
MHTPSLRDYSELILLSAIWGSSFLFLRITAPVFGPAFLIELRVLSGLIFLLPVCVYLGKHRDAIANWRLIALVSLTNMSIPFCLVAFASMSIGAGFASILNSTVPFFAALIGYIFWDQRLSLMSLLGLFVGFSGVVILVLDPHGSAPFAANQVAIAAGITASMFYGIAVNITAHKLQGISGLSITVGSLFVTSVCLAPFALVFKPDIMPTGAIWLSVIALGVLCTGIAYLMFYRLIAKVGANRAITSTFLIPVFSILWGALFLGEQITLYMLGGCLLVLTGIAMTTGKFGKLAKLRL